MRSSPHRHPIAALLRCSRVGRVDGVGWRRLRQHKQLRDEAEIGLSREVIEADAVVHAALNVTEALPAQIGFRVVVARRPERDVVNAFAMLLEKLCVRAPVVKRLDQLVSVKRGLGIRLLGRARMEAEPSR